MYTISQLVKRTRNMLAERETDFFSDSEIRSWINTGMEELWKTLRSNKEDMFLKIMSSTDSAVFLMDRTYNPSSLKMVPGTIRYTLPPDFIELKYVRPVTTERSNVKFTPVDIGANIFDYISTGTRYGTSDFIYDVVGENTLVVAPQPGIGIDIEIGYIYRIAPMRVLGGLTGTVSIAANGTAVVGAGSNFNSTRHEDKKLITGTGTVSADLDRVYPYIDTVISVTSITLSGNYDDEAVAAGSVYQIEDSLPVQMTDYSNSLVDYAVMVARSKDRAPDSFRGSAELFNRGEVKTRQSSSSRTDGPNMVDSYLD